MKQIQYVLTDRRGEIATFRIVCSECDSDPTNLALFAPERLRGYAATLLDKYQGKGFSLSNWHVIDA